MLTLKTWESSADIWAPSWENGDFFSSVVTVQDEEGEPEMNRREITQRWAKNPGEQQVELQQQKLSLK